MKMLKRFGIFMFFVGLVAMVIFVKVSGAKLDAMMAPQVVTPAATSTDTYDAFFQRKVDEYKKTPEFQTEAKAAYAETDAKLDKLAKLRITNGILTKIEQQN